ncbi:ABC transporter substrate-binding protein [Planobispora rosea]|uniref:ABC transporter substrate-binding protein n=1 Tax=Planobispora rosea TaxID=35762 RepID=A0A8J3RWK2_PLARO|nr:MCE family protein [Planobispora rosea]GGS50722.1 ABC transporter substrate-binding protein [Planobispora rosea]GIH82553.1 ABC transporter substrate-binding protein [Planobispora rosea]
MRPVIRPALPARPVRHGPARPVRRGPARPVRRGRRALVSILLTGVLLAVTGGCSLLPGGPAPYRLTAYFAAAPSLYEQAKVKVMGLDAGTVEKLTVEGNRVRADLVVDGGIPLPADVQAIVAPQNTLGERNVVLHPPWKPGMPLIEPGAVIPLERTDLPVEIDDALEAFTKLTDALDTDAMGEVAGDLADSVRGRGEQINEALEDTAALTRTLAGQDEQLIDLAENLNKIATNLNERERQVKTTIDAFAEASATLADERERMRRFVTGLAEFVQRGDVLVEAYQVRLPRGVTNLAELVITLKVNSESAADAIAGTRTFVDNMVMSWDREQHVLKFRLVLNAMTRAWLTPLFDALGLGEVPCLPGELSNCPWQRGRR